MRQKKTKDVLGLAQVSARVFDESGRFDEGHAEVAPLTEQPANLPGCVAVVYIYANSIERGTANCTGIVLRRLQLRKRLKAQPVSLQ